MLLVSCWVSYFVQTILDVSINTRLIVTGIMAVLFGTAYPEENFPGGYKGKETAGISAFFIVFTLIGYYGAHRQRIYFLIPYSIIIFLFLGGNLMMWSIKPEDSVLNPDSDAIKIIGSVFALVMVCAMWLAWQERKKNLQLYGTTSVPRSISNYFTNPNPYLAGGGPGNFQQQQNTMYQSTNQSNAFPPIYQQQPPMYQNNYQNQPQSFQMWDIDSKFNNNGGVGGNPVNLLYQPGSNSYISLERSSSMPPPMYQQRDQQSSQSNQFGQNQHQFGQQQRMDQQQQVSRMNGSIGQQQQSSQSSSGGPLIMY